MALMALTLTFSAACRADDGTSASAPPETGSVAPAPEATVRPEAPNADSPKARVHRPPTHRTADQGIDESVRRMTRSLDLDSGQQAKLREILQDEQRQVMKLRSGDQAPGADRAGTTFAILEQAKGRIRAMLTEEQKKKYITDVPREQTAPAQADLQHWIDIQQSNGRKGGDGSK
jgi:hypothetical protein